MVNHNSSEQDHPTRQHEDHDFDTPQAPSFYLSGDFSLEQTDEDLDSFGGRNLPTEFGPYRLESVVGKGGAGVVFRAYDNRRNQFVALKMLRGSVHFRPTAVSRFRKESVLQASVDSKFVARHLEFEQIEQNWCICSEFIVGVSVDRILTNDGIPETLALRIVADLLKGLNELHSIGMVHRDIKPGNMMLVTKDGTDQVSIENFDHIKLTDFGLARHVDQSESMALTQQRTVLGTPLYMAPEQYVESRSVDAAADVYAVGATLYHLLCGRPPFVAMDSATLAEKHRVETPRHLSQVDAKFGEAISQVVARSLEKSPNQRYENAAAMLVDMEQLLANQPIQISAGARIPSHDHAAVRTYCFEWELAGTVRSLWPLISDTDRFNQAIGLPIPDFSVEHNHGQRTVNATANFKGMKVRWKEHPFRWIVEKEFSVLREFDSGPFKWVSSEVELAPLSGNRTRVTHRFRVEPRGWLGKLMTPIQFGWSTKPGLDRAYRRIETLASSRKLQKSDQPFGRPVRLSKSNQSVLDQKLNELNQHVDDVAQTDAFASYLSSASDRAVKRIRPIPLSRSLECLEEQAMSLCLSAVAVGLLKLEWEVICPACRVAAESKSSLDEVEEHGHCEACNADFEVDVSNAVELVFAVHSSIRQTVTGLYCIGGPYHAPHVLMQNQMDSHQELAVGVTMDSGAYAVKSPQLNCVNEILASEESSQNNAVVKLNTPQGVTQIGCGAIQLRMENDTNAELQVRLEQQARDPNVTTAATASQHPDFKRIFPNEIRTLEQLASVSEMFAVLIRASDADQWAEEMGDIRLREFWSEVESTMQVDSHSYSGGVEHDRVLMVFERVESAINSVLTLIEWIESSEFSIDQFSILVNQGKMFHRSSAAQPFFGECIRGIRMLARTESQNGLLGIQSFFDGEFAEPLLEILIPDHGRLPDGFARYRFN